MTQTHSRRGKLLTLLLLAAALGTGWHFWSKDRGAQQAQYRTQPVDRGDIVQTIAANGTLNPVVLVNVGTQVSGTVKQLHADFNDRVAKGQILAELDPSLFLAQQAQDQASLLSAQSSLKLARIKERQQRALQHRGFVSEVDLDQAAQAVEAARAQVAQAQAQLKRDETNLRYTVIRSPISGVVVARNVDLGQTVAASFQTPTLFQIAQDLRQMQIDTSVAEADVGDIHIGQPVRFTVDAFPDATFFGTVKQVRLNPTIQQNVVTYNVVVAVNNAEGKLMPGMTAHVHITVESRKNVLRIPNAALRFEPKQGAETDGGEPGTSVYRLGADNKLTLVKVKTGITDNTFTELVGGDLRPGDKLAVRQVGQDRDKDSGGFKFRL